MVGTLLLIPLQQYFYLQFGNDNLFLIAYGVLFILILRLLPGGISPSITGLYRRVLVARKLRAAAPPGPPGVPGAPGATPAAAVGKDDAP